MFILNSLEVCRQMQMYDSNVYISYVCLYDFVVWWFKLFVLFYFPFDFFSLLYDMYLSVGQHSKYETAGNLRSPTKQHSYILTSG